MKIYKVLLNPKTASEFRRLPQQMAERIKENLKHLRENPTKARSGMDVKHLTGTLTGTSNPKLYRLRVGEYRAIFWVDDEKGEVLVEKIAPRKRAYIGI